MSGRLALEQAVAALASECDGARLRDGRGFSRADAQEGARLAAMAAAGIPWSKSDAERALAMAARHPMQAASLLVPGSEGTARALAGRLKAGGLAPATEPVEDSAQPSYCFAALSPGGRDVYFWKTGWIGDLKGFFECLRRISRIRHGERTSRVVNRRDAEATINGKRRRLERWEAPFNGSTVRAIAETAARHGFALDPAVAKGPDPLVDGLRRSARACWIRQDRKAESAVFDLARPDPAFSARVKSQFRGRFSCSPSDDWNWILPWGGDDRAAVRTLAREFGFACDPAMEAG